MTLAERGAPEGRHWSSRSRRRRAAAGSAARGSRRPAPASTRRSSAGRPAICRRLTLAGGVAVADGIRAPPACRSRSSGRTTSSSPTRTRPARRRKLAGILAEGVGRNGRRAACRARDRHQPPACRYPPDRGASHVDRAELGRTVEAAPVLAEMLAALNEQVEALCRGGKTAGPRRWRALAPSALRRPRGMARRRHQPSGCRGRHRRRRRAAGPDGERVGTYHRGRSDLG